MALRDKLFVLLTAVIVAGCLLSALQTGSTAQVSGDQGRFQMQALVSEMEGKGAVFVLDAETGHVWAHPLEGGAGWVPFGSPATD